MIVVQSDQPLRGAGLILAHCAALEPGRPSAFARLSEAIGDDLASLLVRALVGPQGRCGSSSP